MKDHQKAKRKIISGSLMIVIIGLIIGGILFLDNNPKASGVLQELRAKNGYIRTVESEEYEFFQNLVSRDMNEVFSETELEEKTREKINRANAEFLLGNQMGLCNPYSFESFQMEMENENAQRRIKKQKNEIFYGPEQFDLITYYVYISGNLKMDMVSFIMANADEEVLKGSKAYFQDQREKYRSIEKIEYLLTENGTTEQKKTVYEELSTMEKTDAQLFEFLYSGKKGDKLEYFYQEHLRSVEIVNVKYEKLTYKNNAERVMRDYITNVYLDNWLKEIEENYPVEFYM